MSSGLDLSAMSLIVFSIEEINKEGAIELKNNKEFVDLFKLDGIDFLIQMDQEDGYLAVVNSSLRHTFYTENKPQDRGEIKRLDKDIKQFWQEFVKEGATKLPLKIHCLPEHRKFVNQSDLFDITWIDEDPDIWTFSYGRLLGAFRRGEDDPVWTHHSKVTMWLFDVTEAFDLELFLPLVNVNNPCTYTKNQKAVLFNPNHYADFRICGDIVK